MTDQNTAQTEPETLEAIKRAFLQELASMAETIADQARRIEEHQAQKHDAQEQLRIEVEQRHRWERERTQLLAKLAVARGYELPQLRRAPCRPPFSATRAAPCSPIPCRPSRPSA